MTPKEFYSIYVHIYKIGRSGVSALKNIKKDKEKTQKVHKQRLPENLIKNYVYNIKTIFKNTLQLLDCVQQEKPAI